MKGPHNRVVCPHCDHRFTLDEMVSVDTVDCGFLYELAHKEEIGAIKCPVCDQEFWVKGGWNPEFYTSFSEEELE